MNKLMKYMFFASLFFLIGCGFKISNNILHSEFYVQSVENEKNKKIDFLIKQSLKNTLSNKDARKNIILKIQNSKLESINEKNKKNKITKYEMVVTTKVKVFFINEDKTDEINVISSGIYNVASAHISTKQNQDNLEKFLSNKNVEKILRKLEIIKDDI